MLASADVPNLAAGHSHDFCDGPLGESGAEKAAHFGNLLLSEDRSTVPLSGDRRVLPLPVSFRIRDVRNPSVPPQIRKAVVVPVAIIMARLGSQRRIADERQQHEPVDIPADLPTTRHRQAHRPVAASVPKSVARQGSSKSSWLAPAGRPHASVIACFVSWESWDVAVVNNRLVLRHASPHNRLGGVQGRKVFQHLPPRLVRRISSRFYSWAVLAAPLVRRAYRVPPSY
jgi:hypothetical protein